MIAKKTKISIFTKVYHSPFKATQRTKPIVSLLSPGTGSLILVEVG